MVNSIPSHLSTSEIKVNSVKEISCTSFTFDEIKDNYQKAHTLYQEYQRSMKCLAQQATGIALEILSGKRIIEVEDLHKVYANWTILSEQKSEAQKLAKEARDYEQVAKSLAFFFKKEGGNLKGVFATEEQENKFRQFIAFKNLS